MSDRNLRPSDCDDDPLNVDAEVETVLHGFDINTLLTDPRLEVYVALLKYREDIGCDDVRLLSASGIVSFARYELGVRSNEGAVTSENFHQFRDQVYYRRHIPEYIRDALIFVAAGQIAFDEIKPFDFKQHEYQSVVQAYCNSLDVLAQWVVQKDRALKNQELSEISRGRNSDEWNRRLDAAVSLEDAVIRAVRDTDRKVDVQLGNRASTRVFLFDDQNRFVAGFGGFHTQPTRRIADSGTLMGRQIHSAGVLGTLDRAPVSDQAGKVRSGLTASLKRFLEGLPKEQSAPRVMRELFAERDYPDQSVIDAGTVEEHTVVMAMPPRQERALVTYSVEGPTQPWTYHVITEEGVHTPTVDFLNTGKGLPGGSIYIPDGGRCEVTLPSNAPTSRSDSGGTANYFAVRINDTTARDRRMTERAVPAATKEVVIVMRPIVPESEVTVLREVMRIRALSKEKKQEELESWASSLHSLKQEYLLSKIGKQEILTDAELQTVQAKLDELERGERALQRLARLNMENAGGGGHDLLTSRSMYRMSGSFGSVGDSGVAAGSYGRGRESMAVDPTLPPRVLVIKTFAVTEADSASSVLSAVNQN